MSTGFRWVSSPMILTRMKSASFLAAHLLACVGRVMWRSGRLRRALSGRVGGYYLYQLNLVNHWNPSSNGCSAA